MHVNYASTNVGPVCLVLHKKDYRGGEGEGQGSSVKSVDIEEEEGGK
jgi:hypothetical protein